MARWKLTLLCALALVLASAGTASASTCATDSTSGIRLCGVDFAAAGGYQFSGEVATYSGLQSRQGTVTIEWGDGSSSQGTRSSGVITGSHTYVTAGSYTVAVTDPVPGSVVGIIGLGAPNYLTATATATVVADGSSPPPPASTGPTLTVAVSGSQVYGSRPLFETAGDAPSGDTFAGTVTCSGVGSHGVQISATLGPGRYRLDGESCFGLSLTGLTASEFTLSFEGGLFFVAKAPTSITRASVKRGGRRLRFGARLVGIDGPLAGAVIVFFHGHRPVCRATTGSSGRATCTASRPIGRGGKVLYKAKFAGSRDYLPARAPFFGHALPFR